MDTQPLNHDQAPPVPETGAKPRRRWCALEGDSGAWVVWWVTVFIPATFIANEIDEAGDLLWVVFLAGIILGLGAAARRLFKNRT
jgi:hypothetical protein